MINYQGHEIDVKDFSRECRRILFDYIIKKYDIDNDKEHLRVIWTKSCHFIFDELPSKWQVFAAIISDKGNKKCYVKFVKYIASFDSKYDRNKPIEKQLKIESHEPILDLYSFSRGKEMAIRGLNNLTKELEKKYSKK